MTIVMDEVSYTLGVVMPSLEESFRIEDGPNADTLLTGEDVRDVVGTYFEHTMSVEPMPGHREDYDAFYLAISNPVDFHTITLPHGQGTITYHAKVLSGSHALRCRTAGINRYTGLTVTFVATAPQLTPED